MSGEREDFIEIGRILKPFGIKGDLKIRFYIDNDSDLKNTKEFFVKDRGQSSGFRTLTVESMKFDENPENAKARFVEISDRTQAEAWRLVPIFVKKDNLSAPKEGEFFINDLLDSEAIYNNNLLGTIYNLITVSDYEVFVIKQPNSKQDLAIPFTERYVESVSIENKKIYFQNVDELLL